MMDIEKLIETLRQRGVAYVRAYGRYCSICDEVVTALSTLQAENEKLRADLARVTAERDGAVEDICVAQWISCKYGTGCDFISARTGRPDCAGCGGWEWRGIKED